MSQIKFDKKSFLEAMEPGITSYVVKAFEDELEKQLNSVIESVFKEMRSELPDKIKSRVEHMFDVQMGEDRVNVVVDLRACGEHKLC